jgi:hypothetical protein
MSSQSSNFVKNNQSQLEQDIEFDSSNEDSEKSKKKDNWVDFYSSPNDADYFLQECLKLDLNERQTPTSLLAHPIFRELNIN